MLRLMELQRILNERASEAINNQDNLELWAQHLQERYNALDFSERKHILAIMDNEIKKITQQKRIYKGFIMKFKDEHKLQKFMNMLKSNNYEFEETDI